MRMKPGCGCLLIVLGICNLVFVVADIVSIVRGPSENPVQPSTLMLLATALIFVANVAVCVMLGLAAFRGVSIGRKPAADDADEMTEEHFASSGTEGQDEDES